MPFTKIKNKFLVGLQKGGVEDQEFPKRYDEFTGPSWHPFIDV